MTCSLQPISPLPTPALGVWPPVELSIKDQRASCIASVSGKRKREVGAVCYQSSELWPLGKGSWLWLDLDVYMCFPAISCLRWWCCCCSSKLGGGPCCSCCSCCSCFGRGGGRAGGTAAQGGNLKPLNGRLRVKFVKNPTLEQIR